jgi:hypothetical protein
MKKNVFFITMSLCLSASVFSQGINRHETDDFTGEKIIATTWDQLNASGLSCKNVLLFKFRLENGTQYFHLNWISNGIITVSDGEKVMFKMKDGSIIKFNNLSHVIASRGGGSTNITCNDAYGVSLILKSDLALLSDENNLIEKVRIYTTDGYVDIDIKEKLAKKVFALYKIEFM